MSSLQAIAIAGAGIGGLTLALALQQRGIDCQVFEQTRSFQPVGYGIQISPNASRILTQLGLAESLATVAHRCQDFRLLDFATGRLIASWTLKSTDPYYQLKRSDLQTLLLDAVTEQNRTAVSFAQPVQSYQQQSSLQLQFASGRSLDVAALVAADGVHSTIREQLFPQYKSQYAGYTAWRVVLPYQPAYAGLLNQATAWLGENRHVVAYPLGPQQHINLVLIAKQPWISGSSQSWQRLADKADIHKYFNSHCVLLNRLLEDIQHGGECYQWALFDHSALPYWTEGKVTLLGDAAHPMLPFMAQGAAMAIEDAYVLAQQITIQPDMATALQVYQQMRLYRTARVQAISRRNADIFHVRGLPCKVRNAMLRLSSRYLPMTLQARTGWIYDYTVELEKCN